VDIKTLEYMEERVKKGREMLEQINHLKNVVKGLEKGGIYKIVFSDVYSNIWARVENCRAVGKMAEACIREAEKEIARLEQELAEL
jgi:hypothetical protein